MKIDYFQLPFKSPRMKPVNDCFHLVKLVIWRSSSVSLTMGITTDLTRGLLNATSGLLPLLSLVPPPYGVEHENGRNIFI